MCTLSFEDKVLFSFTDGRNFYFVVQFLNLILVQISIKNQLVHVDIKKKTLLMKTKT